MLQNKYFYYILSGITLCLDLNSKEICILYKNYWFKKFTNNSSKIFNYLFKYSNSYEKIM